MGLKKIKKIYKFQSQFYDLTRWIFVWNRKKALIKLNLKQGEKVLVVGCGTGYGFDFINKKIGIKGEIIGVDYSSHMLDKARKKINKYKLKNIKLIQIDAVKYIPPKVDVVIYSYSITMVPEWRKSLENSIRVLKEGGRIVITDFSEINVPILRLLLNLRFKKYGVNNKLPLKKELDKYFNNIDYKEYFLGYNFIALAKISNNFL